MIIDPVLNIFRGKAVTIPPMDGALRPNTALDEAFAELGARNAKREALLRAFEASGRSVAEFAEMYGMHPAEVKRMLASKKPQSEKADPA